ncbi:MAG: hypothetical protein ACR2IS_14450, partial [Nitrososphaeraceae archaeon]
YIPNLEVKLSRQSEYLRKIIASKNYDELDGKIIFSLLAGIFDLKPEELIRDCAQNIIQTGNMPKSLDKIVSQLRKQIRYFN